MTAAAIEALNAAGQHDTEAQHEAFGFLHEAQDPDGGFPEFTGEAESNTASTSWAVQAIWSAGENPETWKAEGLGQGTPGLSGIDAARRRQHPVGGEQRPKPGVDDRLCRSGVQRRAAADLRSCPPPVPSARRRAATV